ncbi:MAG: insulinase family protein [Colwellia sp.]|nr:insulinase family protein [Colwellia sp.]
MKYSKIAIVTLLLCSQLSVASFASKNEPTTEIIKSPNDSRHYQTFTLANGLEVLLASDESLSETAVSLTVGVGQYQDPTSQPGLAHYVEHMIFMGSKKHPEPGAMMKYIKANNGYVNAMTEAEQTTYLFKVATEQFTPAIALFTDAIKAPLFTQELSKKELNAIDSEWQRARQTDGFTINRVNALTSNNNHPKIKFGAGNLTSLSDKKGSILQEELIHFYQQYYSANIMKLALVGNQSLADLKKIAQHYFADIPNHNIERPNTQLAAFEQADLQKNIYLKTQVATDTLMLQFPLTSNLTTWHSKPNKYVEYLLSSQEQGTLASLLLKKGLIEAMQPMFMPNSYGQDGTAIIMFVLTDQGIKQKHNIITAFNDYIALISEQGINQQYADELANMLKNQFDNFQNPSAIQLAGMFSRKMLTIDTRDILQFDTHFTGLNKLAIDHVVKQLSPKKMRIWHISDAQETDSDLVYANGSYRIEDIKQSDTLALTHSTLKVNLPAPAEIELAEPEMQLTDNIARPEKIFTADGIQAWLMNSQHFSRSEGMISISLESKVFQKDAKHHAMTNTFIIALSKELQRIATRAQQRHQVYISASQNKWGNLAINFAGKSVKQEKYIKQLVDKIQSIELSQKKLNGALKLYRESLANIEKAPLRQQAEVEFGIMMKSSPMQWSIEEIISASNKITLADFKAFQQALLTTSYVDVFAFGKYNSATITKIAKNVRNTLGETTQTTKPHYKKSYQVVAGTMVNNKIDISLDNVFLKDTYIYPKESEEVEAQLMVLNKLFESSLFKALRTEKQMAYEVGSHVDEVHKRPTFSLFIQSNNTDLSTLKQSFDQFISGFYLGLTSVDEAVFEQVKASIISKLQQKPENVYVEASVYFADWLELNNKFDSKSKAIQLISATNKDNILALYQEMFIERNSENIVLQLRGEKQKKQAFYNYNEVAKAH